MTFVEGVSLIASAASIVLACVAIFYSYQADKKTSNNYERTGELLSEIGIKAEVIQSAVGETQQKLVDTVIQNAKPRQSQEEVMMQTLLPMARDDPEGFRHLMEAFGQQQNAPEKNPRPSRAERRRNR